MQKVKLEDRIENAVNAFFETHQKAELAVYEDDSLTVPDGEPTFSEKAVNWVDISRQVFLLLPGAFLLFYVTLLAIFFYGEIGWTFQMFFMFSAGIFLCWAGSGSLKKTWNLLVPMSVILVASIAAMVFSFFPPSMEPSLYFQYSIYLFPIVLVVAALTKRWADE